MRISSKKSSVNSQSNDNSNNKKTRNGNSGESPLKDEPLAEVAVVANVPYNEVYNPNDLAKSLLTIEWYRQHYIENGVIKDDDGRYLKISENTELLLQLPPEDWNKDNRWKITVEEVEDGIPEGCAVHSVASLLEEADKPEKRITKNWSLGPSAYDYDWLRDRRYIVAAWSSTTAKDNTYEDEKSATLQIKQLEHLEPWG